MNHTDYEQTLVSLEKRSMDALYRLMFETRDDFLAYKIRKFIDAMEQISQMNRAGKAHLALTVYAKHALCVCKEKETEEMTRFFNC